MDVPSGKSLTWAQIDHFRNSLLYNDINDSTRDLGTRGDLGKVADSEATEWTAYACNPHRCKDTAITGLLLSNLGGTWEALGTH